MIKPSGPDTTPMPILLNSLSKIVFLCDSEFIRLLCPERTEDESAKFSPILIYGKPFFGQPVAY